MEKMELMDELQVHYKDFVKRMKGRVSYDDYETQSLLEGYTEELASFIPKELDKAREEGRREVLEDMKKVWDTDNLGDAPKYGSAGAGMMKRWIIDDIKERLSKLKDNK